MEEHLSRRERQIMDAVYSLGKGTVTQIMEEMDSPPSRSAVRTFLTLLERRGYLRHKQNGKAYIYEPTNPGRQVGKSALKRVIDVFFDGSLEGAVAAHLNDSRENLSEEELKRISNLIEKARKKGK